MDLNYFKFFAQSETLLIFHTALIQIRLKRDRAVDDVVLQETQDPPLVSGRVVAHLCFKWSQEC